MNTKGELKKFSEFVTTIRSITRVYEQAAARKMKQVKLEIDRIDKYLAAAKETYASTKVSMVAKEPEHKREVILRTSFRRTKKKRILILISSQRQYYGQLIFNTFNLFLDEYKKTRSDALILGNTGRQFLKKQKISGSNIGYFDFDDSNWDWEMLHKVGQIIAEYEQVIVYYGEYKTVLTQEPKRGDLSQNVVVTGPKEAKKYLFRPKPGEHLSFLEKQMISGDFLEKMYESQVAKYAARIKILEIGQVAEKISQAIDQLGRDRRKVRKIIYNRKQQQLFCGLKLWEGQGLTR